jgi:anti-sigma-K factor RskA
MMTLSHDTLQELLAGYALGALSDDEAQQVQAHLPGCAECREVLSGYQHVSEGLAQLVLPRVAPSHLEADLRARLAATRKAETVQASHVRQPRPMFSPTWRPLAFAAAFSIVLALGLWLALARLTSGPSETQVAEAILSSDEAVRVAIVPDDIAPDTTGEVVLSEDGRTLVVRVEDLPPLPEEQVYQLWLIEGERRDSGGTYHPNEEVWLVRAPQHLDTYDALGVTIEPAGGSPGPTGPRVLRADLPSSL